MHLRGVLLDAHLLVLLTIGSFDLDLVGNHPRLNAYSRSDFHFLSDLIEHSGPIRLVPQVMAEASNLLGTRREALMTQLGNVIMQSVEIQVPAEVAIQRAEFRRLGITDAVLIEAATPEIPLVTADGALFDAALRVDPDCAILFNPTGTA